MAREKKQDDTDEDVSDEDEEEEGDVETKDDSKAKSRRSQDDDDTAYHKSYAEVSGPIAGWVAVLFITLGIVIFFSSSSAGFLPLLVMISSLILFLPGSLILPLAVGAAIGMEVGQSARSFTNAVKGGLLNSIYAVLVYLIAIFIIYEVLGALNPALLSQKVSRSFLLNDWLVFPAVITIAVSEVFAVLSYSRRMKV